jgi:hypothetical protein
MAPEWEPDPPSDIGANPACRGSPAHQRVLPSAVPSVGAVDRPIPKMTSPGLGEARAVDNFSSTDKSGESPNRAIDGLPFEIVRPADRERVALMHGELHSPPVELGLDRSDDSITRQYW